MKKKEIAFIGVFVAIALVVIGIYAYINGSKQYAEVIDLRTNEVLLKFDINEDAYYELDVPYGKFHIEVKDGKYHAVDVDCPNQTCVNLGWAPSFGVYTPIICLPNSIEIVLVE